MSSANSPTSPTKKKHGAYSHEHRDSVQQAGPSGGKAVPPQLSSLFNPYDNLTQVYYAFQKPKACLREIFFPYLTVGGFIKEEADLAHYAAFLVCRGNCEYNQITSGKLDSYALISTIANVLLARNMESNYLTNIEECKRLFKRGFLYYLTKTGVDNAYLTDVDEAQFNQQFDGTDLPKLADLADAEQLDTNLANTKITPELVKKALVWLLSFGKMTPRLLEIRPKMYVLAFVSLGKRGVITESKCEALNEAFKEGFSSFKLNPELVALTYSHLPDCVDEHNAEEIFTTWRGYVARLSPRCSLILQQTAYSGLTAFCTIKKAVAQFPSFSWGRVAMLLPLDFDNFLQAVDLVRDNPYYGFKKDLGVVKSTQYRSLAYVAKELLEKYGGPSERGIKGYAGWTKSPVEKHALDKLIEDYSPYDPEHVDEAHLLKQEQMLTAARKTVWSPAEIRAIHQG